MSQRRVRGLLSRTQNKGLMAKTVRQGWYKRTRTEGSKVWHNDVHKNVSNYSSLSNGQYSSALIFEEGGGGLTTRFFQI